MPKTEVSFDLSVQVVITTKVNGATANRIVTTIPFKEQELDSPTLFVRKVKNDLEKLKRFSR